MIDLQIIIDGLEMVDDMNTVFLDLETGDTVYLSDFDPSLTDDTAELLEEYPDRFLRLPDQREINEYGMMEDFITTVHDARAAEWLKNAIKGRGAFRMFRATCDRFDLTDAWYTYREHRYRDLAVDWCLENGIAYEDVPDVPEPEAYEYEETPETVFPRQQTKEIRYGAVSRKNRLPVILLVRDDLKEAGEDADTEDAAAVMDVYAGDACAVFAAMENGIPIGYIALYDDRVERMYVRPAYRRRGIGTALLRMAEENGDLRIDLVPGHEEAETFFRHRGYGTVELIRLRK